MANNKQNEIGRLNEENIMGSPKASFVSFFFFLPSPFIVIDLMAFFVN